MHRPDRRARVHTATAGVTRRRVVIGDVHGELEKLAVLLSDARIVDVDLNWSAGDTELWFMGDFVDRGPDGIGVVELVMRLEREAADAGGKVGSVLGNHELMLVSAQRFGFKHGGGPGGSFLLDWLYNGGRDTDIQRLTLTQSDWLLALPALALVDHTLLVHADAAFYFRYGNSIEEVNSNVRAVLQGDHPRRWDRLLGEFAERRAFERRKTVERFLRTYGGTRIVHGHTPIPYVARVEPAEVRGPLVYAGGVCVNVDGGMYAGGPGFVYELP